MTPSKTTKKEDLFPSLLSDFFDNSRFFGNRWLEREFSETIPAVNVREKSGEFEIDFAAPGFNKSDFRVNVESNVLTVTAEKKEEKQEVKDRFTRKEFSYNSFSRSFTLPQVTNADKIEARYNDGILKLCIPKKEEAKAIAKKEFKVG